MILAEEVGDLCDELEVIVCLFVCLFFFVGEIGGGSREDQQ